MRKNLRTPTLEYLKKKYKDVYGEVVIEARDLHTEMKFDNRYPSIFSTLKSKDMKGIGFYMIDSDEKDSVSKKFKYIKK